MPSPVVIVLAGGKGERFTRAGASGHKLDARIGADSVLGHVLRAVDDAGLRWHLVRPAGGTSGMGVSITQGVRATAEASGWLLLPADLPLIRPASLQAIAAGLAQYSVVVPWYRQQHGHPVGFGRRWLPQLLALSGDTGAKAIVHTARTENEVYDLALDDAGITFDIDTPDDLRAARLHSHTERR